MKKILYLFLILALSMCCPAFANEEEGTEYKNSIEFLSSIGVLDNHTADDSENEISRIEFATVIAGIVFPNQNYTWSEEMFYTDVVEEYKAIVSALAEKEIMMGYDLYTFKPEQPITYNEALKTLVSLTGYDYQAIANGGYPYGYASAASSIGLLKSFANKTEHELNLGEAAKLIENALKADIMVMNLGSEGVVYTSQEGENLLKRKLDIYEGEGLFKANEDTNIYGGNNAPKNSVIIGENVYDITGNAYENYLGHYVEVYYRADDRDSTERELLYMYDEKNVSALSISSLEITGYAGREYTYCRENETRQRRADISKNAAVLYNYRIPVNKTDEELYLPKVGAINLIDNDGDEEYDVVFIWDYETYVVESVSAEAYVISDYFGKDVLDLDPDEVESRIIMDGSEAGIEKIEKWNVLSVAKSEGDSPFITVVVSDKMITGSVTTFEAV